MKEEMEQEQTAQRVSVAELQARVAELEQTAAQIKERDAQIAALNAQVAATETAKCAKVAELRARLAEVDVFGVGTTATITGANMNQLRYEFVADEGAAVEPIAPAAGKSAASDAAEEIERETRESAEQALSASEATAGDASVGDVSEAARRSDETATAAGEVESALPAAIGEVASGAAPALSAVSVGLAVAALSSTEAEPGNDETATVAGEAAAAPAAARVELSVAEADDVDAPEHLHWRLGNLEGVAEIAEETDAGAAAAEAPAAPEAMIDTGLPIPSDYDVDLMRAMVQDPFHLFVHWQLKGDPYEKLRLLFPAAGIDQFHTVLRLIDEGTGDAAFFAAPFAREHWFNVFPAHTYRVELGLRSPRYGFVKLLGSQAVLMPRGGPSEQVAEEVEYRIAADDYLTTLRETYTPQQEVAHHAAAADAPADALPQSFRELGAAMTEIEAAGDFEHWWERLDQLELSAEAHEFIRTIRGMGGGELGYLLLVRYLPELLRRTVNAESAAGAETDQPALLHLIEQHGQSASDRLVRRVRQAPGSIGHGPWLPSMTA